MGMVVTSPEVLGLAALANLHGAESDRRRIFVSRLRNEGRGVGQGEAQARSAIGLSTGKS